MCFLYALYWVIHGSESHYTTNGLLPLLGLGLGLVLGLVLGLDTLKNTASKVKVTHRSTIYMLAITHIYHSMCHAGMRVGGKWNEKGLL